jgi:hypothetical protein
MAQFEAPPRPVELQQEQLIYALLRFKKKAEAARAADVPPRTMYNWLAEPEFAAAYRAARREQFDAALAVLERHSAEAAQLLANQIGSENEFVAGAAATRLLDRAFQAQDSIALAAEMTHLRATVEKLKAIKAPPRLAEPTEIVRMEIDHEEAEAAVLRVQWMAEMGNGPQDILDSLRYNRPTSVANEQELLDIVRQKMEMEKAEQAALAELAV